MQLLIIQFFPIVVAAAVVAVGAGIYRNRKRIFGQHIAVLGPKGSGKTTFLNYLRGINTSVSEGTGKEEYKTFTFTLNDGTKIKIKSGNDIGGGVDFKGLYEEMIADSNAVIIVFDVNRYLFDKKRNEEDKRNYQQLTHVRFKHIYNKFVKVHGKIDNERIAVIGSHKDETGKDNETLRSLFSETIKDKDYREALLNCHFCDLTNEKELNKLVNIIFGKSIFKK